MGTRGRPPNLRRNEARDAGLRTYDDSDHPCWCGSETKYTKNAACVACLIEKGKARYAGLEGLALEKRKREDHARYVARVSKT